MSIIEILKQIRDEAITEHEKGYRFEVLIKNWLLSDPRYAEIKQVWLWHEFPARDDFGGKDLGIDLVARTKFGEYWAVQCKFYDDNTSISKESVDTFISNSSRTFTDPITKNLHKEFDARYFVATSGKWSSNAEEATKNLSIPFLKITLETLRRANVNWEDILNGEKKERILKTPKEHQLEAINTAHEYYSSHDRGRLIMACGTGKTYTSLILVEKETLGNGFVLFLVPSISLLNQTLNAWMSDTKYKIHPICICSDPKASKKKSKSNPEDESVESSVDLALPASTNSAVVVERFKRYKKEDDGLIVVFSTYQSIDAVHNAQQSIEKIFGTSASTFDWIICDEAHRTTGVKFEGKDEADFTKIHDDNFIRGYHRLYMTATPRLYAPAAKEKAKEKDYVLCSMDDEKIYGEEFFRVGFGYAVDKKLLTDYKVLVLTVGSEKELPQELVEKIKNGGDDTSFEYASRLYGCLMGLSKQTLEENDITWKSDPILMKRALVFCPNIQKERDECSSKNTTDKIPVVSEAMWNDTPKEMRKDIVKAVAKHIDGTMDANERSSKLSWLEEEATDPNECRILCNVKCLSEGVDVPALDAVIFISPRGSQIDIVQSVGRVMRKFTKSDGTEKKYGYIIVPVVISPNVKPEDALAKNEQFKTVWQILSALRSHDERFNAIINQIALNKHKPDIIVVNPVGKVDRNNNEQGDKQRQDEQEKLNQNEMKDKILNNLSLLTKEYQAAIYAKMVEKVGDRLYWEKWAGKVGGVAQSLIGRIKDMISEEGEHKAIFQDFVSGLRDNINDAISDEQAAEMLGQHFVSKPIFDALFKEYRFADNNTVSRSMESMLESLAKAGLQKDTAVLDDFYNSIRLNLDGIDNLQGRQSVIKSLYESFFKLTFPKTVEQLGIVYTPVECVDFIIRSVNDLLIAEFGKSLSDEGVHILDPFTGTGTFITRLLQSGIIKPEDMVRKYRTEIHCNEIVLLSYYIADVNIESVFHEIVNPEEYIRYGGICLTDTFNITEKLMQSKEGEQELVQFNRFKDNSDAITKQRKAPIQVIIGNPPYSAGQKSANDNAQNLKYPTLDTHIANTYAKESKAILKNSLYDSYIRAFRWASDRIKDNPQGGIIGFISNGGWLNGNSTDGFRKCLEEEFSSIYVFNLRGDQRTMGELSRREGGKIFGAGSRASVVITFLVHKPEHKGKAIIHYCDIGDYLKREEKLKILRDNKSVRSKKMHWEVIMPNEAGDWIQQRSDLFGSFIIIGDKHTKNIKETYFTENHSHGVATSRDVWCYNYSQEKLEQNVKMSIEFYNGICDKIENGGEIEYDSTKFSWSRSSENSAKKHRYYSYEKGVIVQTLYRPFCYQQLYFSKQFNEMQGQSSSFFPISDKVNMVICVNGTGGKKDFSCIISNIITDFELIEKSQCFPLYYYTKKEQVQQQLPGLEQIEEYERKDGITDWVYKHIKSIFGVGISKEDIFYYVYGILHSPDYRTKFNDDLKKSLPRIPIVEDVKDFQTLSTKGKELAALHLNYEQAEPWEGVTVTGVESNNFKVEKMRFPNKEDKSVIRYNEDIVISNIPLEAYQYVVNGRSAIEWIMESYREKTDKDSGIKNDPNDWAIEHKKPRYILDLLLSIITVSMKTLKIVSELPRLDFSEKTEDEEDTGEHLSHARVHKFFVSEKETKQE